MKKISNIVLSTGLTGFYFDDLAAIINGAKRNGFLYQGKPKTEGFTSVRQPGESISVMLVLDDGQIAFGDCVAVQYSGVSGRDPLFIADNYVDILRKEIFPLLIGKKLESFRELAKIVDDYVINGKKLHTAIRYGVTQAILDAVAKAKSITRTEVVANEYNLKLERCTIPIFAQGGDDLYLNTDKMIIRKVDALPHALFNDVNDKLGKNGEKLLEYIKWLSKRVRKVGPQNYNPTIHIDVYSTIGLAFNNELNKIVEYMGKLERTAKPFKLRIETPLDAGSKEGQIEQFSSLREKFKISGIKVEIVADEWCNTLEDIKEFADAKAADMLQIKTPDLGGINNTIEAILYCKKLEVGAYMAGSSNETDISAKITTDIALATKPDLILAKPGMGVD
ncbi:MAG: methylaspartate ammonia-lyase, partial [Actinomycetia bacterium]|nr:methylaspartate ammonia-lyase [Actinomycetes bacterium]